MLPARASAVEFAPFPRDSDYEAFVGAANYATSAQPEVPASMRRLDAEAAAPARRDGGE